MMNSNKKQGGGKLQNNMSMTIDEIISECQTFYMAGQETTKILLTRTMYLLGMHQDWQERARREVLEVCGKNDFPNADTVNGLKTVGMIFNESLRLYPPVVVMIRRTYKPMMLGRLSIPAGTQLQIPILAMHHDPSLWETMCMSSIQSGSAKEFQKLLSIQWHSCRFHQPQGYALVKTFHY